MSAKQQSSSMTKRNERTSPRVVKVAAKVLAMQNDLNLDLYEHPHGQGPVITSLKWRDIRALAASCLTQAADKPKQGDIDRLRRGDTSLNEIQGIMRKAAHGLAQRTLKPKRAPAKRSPAK